MNTLAVQDLLQLQQDLQVLKTAVNQLQQRLNLLLTQVQLTPQTDCRPPLAQLRGLWQGLDLSLEEIQAIEYQGVVKVGKETLAHPTRALTVKSS